MVDARYGIEELADLAGVTRRTIRFYVQEGLLPVPLGRGRGRHYGPEHLKRLLEVKALQERGVPLDAIRTGLTTPAAVARALRVEPADGPTLVAGGPLRSAWSRLEILPGVELHVSSAWRLPSPGRLRDLAEWCGRELRRKEEDDDA